MIYNIKFSWQLSWHLREILQKETPLPLILELFSFVTNSVRNHKKNALFRLIN